MIGMNLSERTSDSYHYVFDGVIRKPATWILLSIFGINRSLIWSGVVSTIYGRFYGLKLAEMAYPHAFLRQYEFAPLFPSDHSRLVLVICEAGYITRIYRGISPAPPVRDWGSLFLDGLKLLFIQLIYSIVPILIFIWTVGIPLFRSIPDVEQRITAHHSLVTAPELIQIIGAASGWFVLSFLLLILLTIISIIGCNQFQQDRECPFCF